MNINFMLEKELGVLGKYGCYPVITRYGKSMYEIFTGGKARCFESKTEVFHFLHDYVKYLAYEKNGIDDINIHLAMLELLPANIFVLDVSDYWTDLLYKCTTKSEFNDIVKRGVREHWIY